MPAGTIFESPCYSSVLPGKYRAITHNKATPAPFSTLTTLFFTCPPVIRRYERRWIKTNFTNPTIREAELVEISDAALDTHTTEGSSVHGHVIRGTCAEGAQLRQFQHGGSFGKLVWLGSPSIYTSYVDTEIVPVFLTMV
jgi:hypothetical protein